MLRCSTSISINVSFDKFWNGLDMDITISVQWSGTQPTLLSKRVCAASAEDVLAGIVQGAQQPIGDLTGDGELWVRR